MPSPRRRLSFPISSSSGFSSPIPYPPRGGYHGLPLSGSHFFLHKKSPPLSAGFHFFALNRPVGSRGSSSDRPFQHQIGRASCREVVRRHVSALASTIRDHVS